MAMLLAMQAHLRRVRGLTRTMPGRLQTRAGPTPDAGERMDGMQYAPVFIAASASQSKAEGNFELNPQKGSVCPR
jgi:hypothetical protein